jgi:hypothetical protein
MSSGETPDDIQQALAQAGQEKSCCGGGCHANADPVSLNANAGGCAIRERTHPSLWMYAGNFWQALKLNPLWALGLLVASGLTFCYVCQYFGVTLLVAATFYAATLKQEEG